jgi:hypothetical protein
MLSSDGAGGLSGLSSGAGAVAIAGFAAPRGGARDGPIARGAGGPKVAGGPTDGRGGGWRTSSRSSTGNGSDSSWATGGRGARLSTTATRIACALAAAASARPSLSRRSRDRGRSTTKV